MILVTHSLFFVPIGPFSYVLSHIILLCIIVLANFVLITRKEGGA